MSTDLACRQPAEVVACEVPDVADRPRQETAADVRWLLRLFALASFLGAGFMFWCAATGYRPF